MNPLCELRNIKTGKIICQSTSVIHAVREAKWRGIATTNAPLDDYRIVPIERDGWGGLIARSIRYMGVWPLPKIIDFAEQWLSGVKVRDMEIYFDTSMTALDKKRRELGLPVREPKGLWNSDDEAAINFMFDEGMTEDEIAQHFKRTKSSVGGRLRSTAIDYSDRRARRTASAPPRYGKTRWPRKKKVL